MTSDKTRHATFFVRAVVFAIIALIGLLTFTAITAVKTIETRSDVREAQRFDPCVSLSEAVAHNADARRLAELTVECKLFLNGLAPLVTVKLACAFIHKGGYVCPAPELKGTAGRQSGGEERAGPVLGPSLPSALGGPTGAPEAAGGGGSGGHHPSSSPPSSGGHVGSGHHHAPHHHAPAPSPTPAPTPAPAPEPAPTPAPAPGNSENTPAPVHPSAEVCVRNPLLPACVSVDAGL